MTELWSIWRRGPRFRAMKPGWKVPGGYLFVAYHAGGEEACRKCAQAMQEDERLRRGSLTRGAIQTPIAEVTP